MKSKTTDNQYLKLKTIKKNKDWYEQIKDIYLPSYNQSLPPDAEERKRLYEIFNNDLSAYQDKLNKMCNNLYDFGSLEREILSFNKLRNKYEVLAGDLLQRSGSYNIVLMSAQAIKNKDEQLKKRLQDSVDKELRRTLREFQDELSQAEPQQIQQFIEQFKARNLPKDFNRTKFMSDLEIYKNKMLKHQMLVHDVKSLQADTFKQLFIEDRFFVRNAWRYGQPVMLIENPLFVGYDKSHNQRDVCKGDYWWKVGEITVGEMMDQFINHMTDDELYEAISNTAYGHSLGRDEFSHMKRDRIMYKVLADQIKDQDYIDPENVGLYQVTGDRNPLVEGRVKVRYLEFKAYEQVLSYAYIDPETNRKVRVFLNGDLDIIPSDASRLEFTDAVFKKSYKYVWTDETGYQYEAERMWIPRRYEMTILGDDLMVNYRKVPMQPLNDEHPFSSFTLSLKGGVMNSMNAESTSLMQNALPYYFQILVLKDLQNKEISKYRGYERAIDVDQIPLDLAEDDDDGTNTQDRLLKQDIISKETGTTYYSGSQTSNSLAPPSTRTGGVTTYSYGTSQEILNLQMLINMIDEEMGITIGVPKAREGQLTKYTTATEQQSSLTQSSLVTELYFAFHTRIWQQVLEEHLEAVDMYWKRYFEENPDETNTLIEYLTPEGTKELIEVLPEYLDHSKVGLKIGSINQNQLYNQYMLENAVNLIQNPESIEVVSDVIKALSSGDASKEEVHQLIQAASEKFRENQQAANQQQMQMIEQQKQAARELEEYRATLANQAKMAEIVAKGQQDTNRAMVQARDYAMAQDINQNQISDEVENDREKREHEKKMQEDAQKHEMSKLEKELKSKEKIAAKKTTK